MTPECPAPDVRAFFVYGTLMRGESNHAVIARHGIASVRAGWVRGALFDTGAGYPAMRATDADGRVQGELVVPQDVQAAMQSMDQLEGFHGEADEDNLYERRLIEVTLADDGSTCAAWTYVYVQDLPSHTRIASGDWRHVRRAPG